MTSQTRTTLKTYFETGDRPTQSQFSDLIDSSLNLSEVSAQVITSDVSALGKMDIGGNFTVKASALTTLTGNVNIGGALTVSGAFNPGTLSSLTISGALTVSGATNLAGITTISNTLNVTGSANTNLTGNLNVTGLVSGATATQAITDNSTKLASTAFVKQLFATTTVYLSADVVTNNSSLYFDGPSTAQGTTGTFVAMGTVTVMDTGSGQAFFVKLWDGTTIISSGQILTTGAGSVSSLSLGGRIVNPTGNIRMSVREPNATGGSIIFNQTGTSKDSSIFTERIG